MRNQRSPSFLFIDCKKKIMLDMKKGSFSGMSIPPLYDPKRCIPAHTLIYSPDFSICHTYPLYHSCFYSFMKIWDTEKSTFLARACLDIFVLCWLWTSEPVPGPISHTCNRGGLRTIEEWTYLLNDCLGLQISWGRLCTHVTSWINWRVELHMNWSSHRLIDVEYWLDCTKYLFYYHVKSQPSHSASVSGT